MQWSGTGVGDTGRPGKTWGGMQASPAPQAAPFDAVAATLSRSLRFQLFRTSIFTNKSSTTAPMNRIGAHVSAAALTTRNCVSKSSRSSSNLPQHVVLSIRHRVSTSWRIASPRMPQPCKSPSEHEYKASPAASCPAARSSDAAENKLRSCSPSSAPA